MTAVTADPADFSALPEPQPPLRGALAASCLLHFLLVLVAVVGLPFMKPSLPEIDTSITVELVDASDVTQTDREWLDRPIEYKKPEQKKEEPPRKVMPMVTATKPPRPTAPKPPQADEFVKPDQKPDEAQKIPAPEKSVTPPKPLKRPVLTRPDDQQEQEEFKSLLRNLMPAEQDPLDGDPSKSGEQASPSARFGPKMSVSELGALKQQLNQCWSVLAGARYAEDLVVELKIFMNPDRSVRDVTIVNQLQYNTDQFYRAAADGAKRAVFKCSPLDLPPDKYDLWKVITVTFDPRKML